MPEQLVLHLTRSLSLSADGTASKKRDRCLAQHHWKDEAPLAAAPAVAGVVVADTSL